MSIEWEKYSRRALIKARGEIVDGIRVESQKLKGVNFSNIMGKASIVQKIGELQLSVLEIDQVILLKNVGGENAGEYARPGH